MLILNRYGLFLWQRIDVMYQLNCKQVYERYHDTDNDIAKLYWLTKLKERVSNGSKWAKYYLDMIEACNNK